MQYQLIVVYIYIQPYIVYKLRIYARLNKKVSKSIKLKKIYKYTHTTHLQM